MRMCTKIKSIKKQYFLFCFLFCFCFRTCSKASNSTLPQPHPTPIQPTQLNPAPTPPHTNTTNSTLRHPSPKPIQPAQPYPTPPHTNTTNSTLPPTPPHPTPIQPTQPYPTLRHPPPYQYNQLNPSPTPPSHQYNQWTLYTGTTIQLCGVFPYTVVSWTLPRDFSFLASHLVFEKMKLHCSHKEEVHFIQWHILTGSAPSFRNKFTYF